MSGIEGSLGPAALPILITLPGAWLAFGIPLHRVSFAGRLALAVSLSPLVLSAQALVLRWAGVAWTPTDGLLCGVNLLAGITGSASGGMSINPNSCPLGLNYT